MTQCLVHVQIKIFFNSLRNSSYSILKYEDGLFVLWKLSRCKCGCKQEQARTENSVRSPTLHYNNKSKLKRTSDFNDE